MLNISDVVRGGAAAILVSVALPLAAAPSEPWTPPAATPPAAAGPLDPAKLPDVGGVHIGASSAEVPAVLHKLFPGAELHAQFNGQGKPPSGVAVGVGGGPPVNDFDNMLVNYTFDSDRQLVYAITRDVQYRQVIAKQRLIDALRAKYGQETAAVTCCALSANDAETDGMYWLFDETGRVVHPANYVSQAHAPYGCGADMAASDVVNAYRDLNRRYLRNELPAATFCDSVIVLWVKFNGAGANPVRRATTVLFDFALARRSAIALGDLERGLARQQKQDEVRKANEAKPNL
jgi:hypothetical protein